uniref:Uncharacterized protein n=1 Tax=Acidobacterium capsulatum TaxID=33075 RepID=A0A7V4XSJ9_9BACT
MNASQTTTTPVNQPPIGHKGKAGFRTKTIATRLTQGEVAEVEWAAERAGKPLSEWLRDAALTAVREQPSDPIELLLAEIWATRYALLSLFHTGAQATLEGKPLSPESVVRIRDRADARKLEEASRMLSNFVARQAEESGEE